MTARSSRPLPQVGDRIRLWYPTPNINTWPRWAEVRAVVDDAVIVVCRSWVKRVDPYMLISYIQWDVFGDAYQHRRGRKPIGLDGRPCAGHPEKR